MPSTKPTPKSQSRTDLATDPIPGTSTGDIRVGWNYTLKKELDTKLQSLE